MIGMRRKWVPTAVAVVGTVAVTSTGAFAQCPWEWSRGFERSGSPFGNVWDSVVHDDGSGPALFICTDGGRVQKFNGSAWTEIGRVYGNTTGVAGGQTYNLQVCDPDGPGPLGPQLFVCGGFRRIQGPTGSPFLANSVARWNGTNWTAETPPSLGTGQFFVRAMTCYDNGGGKRIVIANEALPGNVGILMRNHDGTWAPLDPALSVTGSMELSTLHAFDDGSGEALYVGGLFEGFSSGGTVASKGVIKWNGTSWVGLGAGVSYTTGEGGRVYSLGHFDFGSGPQLLAAGNIASSGGDTSVRGLARWTGSSWVGAPGADFTLGFFGPFIHVLDVGAGPELFLSGRLGNMDAKGVARWDGSEWVSPFWDAVALGQPFAVNAYDTDGSGPGPLRLVACTDRTRHLVGTAWEDLPSYPDSKALGQVAAMRVLDVDGPGPAQQALYAVGSFVQSASGQTLNYLASFDGSQWTAVHGGLSMLELRDETDPTITAGSTAAVEVFDGGSGPELYVGGHFNFLGGAPARRIIRRSGGTWAEVGGGIGDLNNSGRRVTTMKVFDDGSGPALFVAGYFETAGGTTVNHIARWNGTSWSDLAGGLVGSGLVVRALAVFDDGSGPALFVGGTFTSAGGTPVSNIARWNGTSWSDVGGGVNGEVLTLHVHDDGSGPALYAGGSFTTAGGNTVNRIARWDGAAWSALGAGVARGAGLTGTVSVRSLASNTENGTSRLIAGGSFEVAGGQPIGGGIASWDGSAWQSMAGGVGRIGIGLVATVDALASYDAGGSAVYAAGVFDFSGTVSANSFAKWSRRIPADFDNSGTLTVADIFAFLSAWFAGDMRADFDNSGSLGVPDIFAFLSAWFAGCP